VKYPLDHSCSLLPWQQLLIFFILGCFATAYPVAAGAGGVFALMLMKSCGHTPRFGLIAAVVCCGFIHAWVRIPHGHTPDRMTWDAGKQVVITGRIQDSRWRFSQQLYLIAREVQVDDGETIRALPGKLLISVHHADRAPLVGQRFEGRVRLRPVHSLKNPGCWDGKAYWGRKNILYRTYIGDLSRLTFEPRETGVFQSLRQALRQCILTRLPPGMGRALTLALLLGERSQLDNNLYDLLQRAGIVHSLALSGLHLGFMVVFGWVVARGMGWLCPSVYLVIPRPKLAVILDIPLVVFYMWIGGWTPSLLRAGLMFGSWGMLLLLNRTRVLLDGLFLAVLLIVLWSPREIFSLSLQFSVLAVVGIVLLIPPLEQRWSAWAGKGVGRKLVASTTMILMVSLVASLALLPVQAWNFGTLTLHQYYNIVWIPLLGFVLLPLGFTGLLLSMIPATDWLGTGTLLVVSQVMELWCQVLIWAREQGWLEMVQVVRPQWPSILGFYALGVIGIVVWKHKPGLGRLGTVTWGAALGLLVLPSLVTESSLIPRSTRLVVMDTGMSQAVYVELPGNRRVLVDGGGSWSRTFDMGKAVVTPVLTWGRPPRLDAVFLTHSDCDHLRGLIHPLTTCSVDAMYWNGRFPHNPWDRKLLEDVFTTREMAVHQVGAGRRIDMGDGVEIEVLHPPENMSRLSSNDGSLVLRFLVDGKGMVLIPGDIEAEGMDLLLSQPVDLGADVLILPHHGSASSWSEDLYDRVDPRLAVAAAGWNNRYGFPATRVVESLEQRGVEVLTTGVEGAVQVRWENTRMVEVRSMRRGDATIF
jgi:competence protein ComEC